MYCPLVPFAALFAAALFAKAGAQTPGNCTTGPTCPFSAPFQPVTITTNNTYRYVSTTGCPPFNNPGWHTPNAACMAQPPTVFKFPLTPVYAAQPISVGQQASVYNGVTYLKNSPAPQLGVLGVFINGVKIFGFGSPCGYSSTCPSTDPSAPTNYVDAVQSEGRTTDSCGGHADPQYHYHIHSGLGINSTSQRLACNLTADVPGQHSQLLGWMIDGFGMYGRYSLGGQVPTQLDSCHGHTHNISGVLTYHYHLPDAFPWTIGCFKGCPLGVNNPSFNSLSSVYQCPTGLSTDPSPVYETDPSASTATSPATGLSTDPATSPVSSPTGLSTNPATSPVTSPTGLSTDPATSPVASVTSTTQNGASNSVVGAQSSLHVMAATSLILPVVCISQMFS